MTSDFDDTLFPNLNHPEMIEVGVGELAIGQHPRYLMTPALGSCVGLCLWDAALKQGGLAHVMLPTTLDSMTHGTERRFASFAVAEMVHLLHEAGSPRRRLVAKMAGGATMFRTEGTMAHIGERNAAEVRRQLDLLNIPLIAEDTGERHARTLELRLDTGEMVVRSYLYGVHRL
ncbi:MAG: chemotaxis protein CheD [Actinomycetota bacterium]|nr:chemotaxis protein CheD [Actinomycetota bacterium]